MGGALLKSQDQLPGLMGWSGDERGPFAAFSQQMAGGALTITTGDGGRGGGDEEGGDAGGGSGGKKRAAPLQRTRKGQPGGDEDGGDASGGRKRAPSQRIRNGQSSSILPELPQQKPRKACDPALVRRGLVLVSRCQSEALPVTWHA